MIPLQQEFPPKIIAWMQAISKWEDALPSSNNPGNLKYTGLTRSWGALQGRPALDGGRFCQFLTIEAGQDALCNFLMLGCENQLLAFHQARTLEAFTKVFAGNPPQGYINGIAEDLGVPLSTDIASFLTA